MVFIFNGISIFLLASFFGAEGTKKKLVGGCLGLCLEYPVTHWLQGWEPWCQNDVCLYIQCLNIQCDCCTGLPPFISWKMKQKQQGLWALFELVNNCGKSVWHYPGWDVHRQFYTMSLSAGFPPPSLIPTGSYSECWPNVTHLKMVVYVVLICEMTKHYH